MIMKRNISLTLMYDGSCFHGWQMQENTVTVQGHLTEALERILGHKVTVYGCSRTDCGVHANTFCCNFRTDKPVLCEKIKVGVNALIPEGIAVLSAEEKDEAFNARFDCKGKEYIYKVWNSRVRNPFLKDRALHHPIPIDEKMLDKECKAFIGYHDFSAFCASGTEVKDKRRTIYDFSVKLYVCFPVLLIKKTFHCPAEFFRQLGLRRMTASLNQMQFFSRSRNNIHVILYQSDWTDPVART